MIPYYGVGRRPSSKLSFGPQTIFALGRMDADGHIVPLGTGFLLDKTNHLATSAHVIGRSDDRLVMVLNTVTNIDEYQFDERNSFQTLPLKIIAHNPIHDLAVLRVEATQNVMCDIRIGSSDEVKVGAEVVTLGYPHLNMGRSVLTQNLASVGAKVLLSSIGGNVKSLILNLLSRPGQSGAPVFRPASNELIAVLTGAYNPKMDGSIMVAGADVASLHQTTRAISAEYLRGMY